MTGFRYVLIAMTVLIYVFTMAAVANSGINLITPFLTPILALSWQGQFNFDFTCYLVLSGIWMAWRGGVTNGSIGLGILAPPFGILFFAPYLLYLVGKSNGDPRKILLGVHA